MIKMYKIHGAGNHRQRESFYPSYKFKMDNNVEISIINADITGINYYSIMKIEGENESKIENEFIGQLFDGVFENSNYGVTEEITDTEEIKKYIDVYVPDQELIFSAKYYKKWQDSTIQKGKIEEISRNEALDLIFEYYANNGCDDDEIAKEIQEFDKYHIIDLGDFHLTIEGVENE